MSIRVQKEGIRFLRWCLRNPETPSLESSLWRVFLDENHSVEFICRTVIGTVRGKNSGVQNCEVDTVDDNIRFTVVVRHHHIKKIGNPQCLALVGFANVGLNFGFSRQLKGRGCWQFLRSNNSGRT